MRMAYAAAGLRQRMNGVVRKWGNQKTPRLARFGYGLGDVLTTEEPFTYVGAVAGAIAPFAAIYHQLGYDLMEHGCARLLIATAGAIACYPAAGLCSIVGARAGNSIGNIINRQRESG